MPIAALSFTRAEPDSPLDLWPATDVADWSEGTLIGRARADELVAYARDNQAPMVVTHVAAAIIATGRMESIETGFFNQIALHAMTATAAPQIARDPEVDAAMSEDAPAPACRLVARDGVALAG